MRSKEEAHDYRYFPDPDLLPLEISAAWIDEVKAGLPELPEAMKARFEADYGLSAYDAASLTASRETADYFEEVVRASLKDGESTGTADPKLCANWVNNEVAAKLNEDGLLSWQFGVSADTLGHILRRVREGLINAKTAKELFSEFWNQARDSGYTTQGGYPQLVDELIESRGLRQVSDTNALEKIIDEVLAANPKSVEEFRAGKEKAFNALVGQAMKATKGKANPQQVNDLLRKKLGA
jgi:aspartyl-tRNA(Asn)/glutamyl-tRNA(Gln) amidotransferase subunit B